MITIPDMWQAIEPSNCYANRFNHTNGNESLAAVCLINRLSAYLLHISNHLVSLGVMCGAFALAVQPVHCYHQFSKQVHKPQNPARL